MSAFVKTLIGDVWNLSVVAGAVFITLGLIAAGEFAIAPYVVPPLILAGIAWLARR